MTKTIRGWLYFLVGDSIFFSLVYFAVIEQVSGAKNLVYFFTVLILFLAILSLVPGILKKTAEGMVEPYLPIVPKWLSYSLDTMCSMFLIWNDWWWTGVGLLAGTLLWALVTSTLREMSQQNIIDKLSA